MPENASTQIAARTYTPQQAHEWGNVPLAGFAILCLIAVAVWYAAERWFARKDRRETYARLDMIKEAMPSKDTVEEIRRRQIENEAKMVNIQERQVALLEKLEQKQSEIRAGQSENFARMWNMIDILRSKTCSDRGLKS